VNVLRRVFQGVRDAWLMLGIALLMFVLLELGYRAQAGARRAIRGAGGSSIKGPYADSAWFPTYEREYVASFRLRWKPYVYFRRPFLSGEYINVDSAGHRRSVPGPKPARDTLRVFFFGGSTLWGTYQRDFATIPSVAAARLSESTPANAAIEVTNFGESGYVSSQELLELEMQLRDGKRPDVVVFYDGINDVASAVQAGVAGLPQNESNRVREFDFGRAISGTETGVGSDARAAVAIAGAVAQRFQVIQRIRASIARGGRSSRPPADMVSEIASVYAGTVDLVEALSRAYGFRAVYVWQPTLHASRKRFTPFESRMLSEMKTDPFQNSLFAVHQAMPAVLDSAIGRRVKSRFINEAGLFTGDTSSVFMDPIGHTTEAAIVTIVQGFLPTIRGMLDSVSVARRVGCASTRPPTCR
jgi:lysophospholipase L1-like esterase